MSNPTAPGDPEQPNNATPPPSSPDDAPAHPDAPTQAYPDAQPTQAYPDAQPTQAYGSAQPGPAYGGEQPAYGAPQPPVYTTPPTGAPDSRPKTLAIIALIAGVVGFVLGLGGFVPGLGIALGIVAIILLLAALVLSIVALVSKKQGGTGFSIAALIVSVIGGIIASVALVVGLVFTAALTAVENGDFDELLSPAPTTTSIPSDEASDEASETPGDDTAPATGDEASYIAAVRPVITSLYQEITPGATPEQIELAFSDDTLLALGQSILTLEQVSGEEGSRAQIVEAWISADAMSEEQANLLYDTVAGAAHQYLTAE